MTLQDALQLVNEQFQVEAGTLVSGDVTTRYAQACADKPVTMQTARLVFAHQIISQNIQRQMATQQGQQPGQPGQPPQVQPPQPPQG